MVKQRTLKSPISAAGVGVHTGRSVRITVNPAEPNTGIRFRRVDLSKDIEIQASSRFVGDTQLSTTLIKQNIRVMTVEHLLSAMAGLGIDNAIVEINAPEVPIMDGSSAPFVFLLQSAGIVEQDALKKFMRIKKKVRIDIGDAWAQIEPFNGYRLGVQLNYDHPVLVNGVQKSQFDFSTIGYVKEVSRARTFGFMSDYEWLRANNLALGASLDNTVVLDEFRILNEDGLRYKDELVKHKILDAIGDLYLAGHPLIGAFSGFKSGHTLNTQLVKKLLQEKTAWEITTSEEHAKIEYSQPALEPVTVTA